MPKQFDFCTVYTAGQAAKAASVAYHLLDHWSTNGIVVPSICEASGFDTCRAFSFSDVVALAVAKRLREVGFRLEIMQVAASHLQTCSSVELCEMSMLIGTDDGEVVACRPETIVDSLRRNHCVSWMVNVGTVVTEVQAALRNVTQPKRGKARLVGCLTAVG
jgi:DNA-binding transcriptional MerR regulator